MVIIAHAPLMVHYYAYSLLERMMYLYLNGTQQQL